MTGQSLTRLCSGALLAATLTGCLASTQQEVALGSQYAQQINQQLPIVQDAEINRYINVLGDSIARIADDRSLEWWTDIDRTVASFEKFSRKDAETLRR